MPVLFDPNSPDYVKAAYADEQTIVPYLVSDPSLGLYSPTDRSKGGQLSQTFQDGLGQIITGRTSLASFDQLVKDWRSGGGDQMRTEYQSAYAEAKKA
jgi:putative aldouronate transport system substrate-binding protein